MKATTRCSRRRRHNRRRRRASSPDDRGSMGSRGSKKSRGSLTKASSGRRSRDEPPVDDSEMLSYAEFCEAVLRLAMLKWEDEGHALDDPSRRCGMPSPRSANGARTPRLPRNAAASSPSPPSERTHT